MGQSQATTYVYKQSFIGTQAHFHLHIVPWLLWCYDGRAEYLQQRQYIQRSIKYLLYDHLQKKTADDHVCNYLWRESYVCSLLSGINRQYMLPPVSSSMILPLNLRQSYVKTKFSKFLMPSQLWKKKLRICSREEGGGVLWAGLIRHEMLIFLVSSLMSALRT